MLTRFHRVLRPALAALLLCAAPATLRAQVLLGRVIDYETAQAVKFASVELLNDRDQVLARVAADSGGEFRIRSWQAGKYRIRSEAIGYAPVASQILELATGDVLEVTVHMLPNAVPLEPIVIKARARASLAELALAGYYDRRDSGHRLGLGRFFDRGAIERRGRKLTDVLATIPGVRVLNVPNCPVPLISMAGSAATRIEETKVDQLVRIPTVAEACKPVHVCRATVYVDGVQMGFDEMVSIDQMVQLDWVEAIEVYRRASEIPAEFLNRATCGVVAVWTRRG
jgi:hypothetical protein